MSCIWKLFTQKKETPQSVPKYPDLRISNPLNLDEIPDDIVTLQAIEAALIDNLISIHYKLEQIKENVAYSLKRGTSDRVKEALAKRAVLTERKRILQARLAKVQARLKEIRGS